MPASGSGTGTPVICGLPPTVIPDAAPRSCVSLPRYAKIIGYDECALWGVSHEQTDTTCYRIMSQFDRDNLERYLAEAQEEVERVTRYPLCPTWFEDELHPFRYPLHTDWVKVIEAGVRATSVEAAAAGIDYSVEPTCVGPVATAVTDTDEIHVFYPGSEREIEPYSISIIAGQLYVYIPRCRLVSPDYFDNPVGGWDYNDLTRFTDSVDLTRVYNDDSVNAELVWPTGRCCPVCSETAADACLVVSNGDVGEVRTLQANYAAGEWARASTLCCARAPNVRLNYRAGMDPTTLQAEDSVIRLAHSKMPRQPCAGCDYTAGVWRRDREVSEPLTVEQARNPFGRSDGALIAWRFANAMRFVFGSTM